MSSNGQPNGDGDGRHLTTRRGFVTAVGFGIVSLYGLWAAYGAAPTDLSFIADAGRAGGGHGGHGGGGMSPEDFHRLARNFFDDHTMPDGSVNPAWHRSAQRGHGSAHRDAGDHAAEEAGHRDAAHPVADHHDAAPAGHGGDESGSAHRDVAEARDHAADGHRGSERHADAEPGHGGDRRSPAARGHGGREPIDVYIVATRYGYEPELLRLQRDVPYRFRIMAVDADHGVSMNFKMGSRIVRCRARTLTEMTVRFTRPGEHMVYCTVYCGEGHDMMKSKLIVA